MERIRQVSSMPVSAFDKHRTLYAYHIDVDARRWSSADHRGVSETLDASVTNFGLAVAVCNARKYDTPVPPTTETFGARGMTRDSHELRFPVFDYTGCTKIH